MSPTESRRALVICAHDDDEVIGMGGTIRKLADAGVRVSALIFAVGNEGYTRLRDRRNIVARRRRERAAAERVLGTTRCFARHFHDFDSLDCEAVYRTIMRIVRATRPQIVFTHLAAEYLAHRTLACVAPEAVWQAGWCCSLDLGAPWAVSAIYQFSILEFIPKPSHIVNITDTFAAKRRAMEAFASQHAVVAGVLDLIETRARAYGALIGARYGEAFMRSSFIPIRIDDPTRLCITER